MKNQVEIADLEQLGFALGQPFTGGCALALRAVPVPATVERDSHVATCTVLATRNMPAQSGGTAALDGGHHLLLRKADMACIGTVPCGTVLAENVRNHQHGTRHGGRLLYRLFLLSALF